MKIGSLFSGIGGIDLGFQQAGFDISFAVEMNHDACKTYRYNFKNCNLIEEDVKNIDAGELPYIDVLAAGFPCQPFSICGNQKGFSDKRGNLFFDIMRIADSLQCPVLFLENVANLKTHDNGKTFQVIYNEMARRGYYIKYIIADACDYGIPQHRTRIYIVAFKSQEVYNSFRFPDKCKLKKYIFDVIDKNVEVDNSYYLSKNLPQYKRLNEVMTDFEQIYRFSDYGIQVSKDRISFTLKANMGTWYNRVPYIRDHVGIRRITPYECLALQGFPESYRFPKIPLDEAYKQCGNTVCIPVIKALAEQIKKQMPF